MTVEEWKRKNPPIQRKPITNADSIRMMNDEELASFLYWNADGNGKTRQDWLNWLKVEVNGGNIDVDCI